MVSSEPFLWKSWKAPWQHTVHQLQDFRILSSNCLIRSYHLCRSQAAFPKQNTPAEESTMNMLRLSTTGVAKTCPSPTCQKKFEELQLVRHVGSMKMLAPAFLPEKGCHKHSAQVSGADACLARNMLRAVHQLSRVQVLRWTSYIIHGTWRWSTGIVRMTYDLLPSALINQLNPEQLYFRSL